MKKLLGIVVLGISLILLNSCAKPTVVNVVVRGDDKLNCEQRVSSLRLKPSRQLRGRSRLA